MINKNFNDFRLSGEILKAIEMLNFQEPTDVQERVIPAILNKKDVIIKSETGSGKTAAFAIPICELVNWDEFKPQVLVVTPTRELANQVKDDIFNIGRFKRIKVTAVYGKTPIESQIKNLKQKTHFVVGTPGRLIDLINKGVFDVSNIKHLVLDEADEMLNMGFIDQIKDIIDLISTNRVTTLLSATMPKDIKKLCDEYMKNPKYFDMENETNIDVKVSQVRYSTNENEKLSLLHDILTFENPDTAIIFCNTKKAVDNISKEFEELDYPFKKLHGGMDQRDRTKVMADFKKGYFRYLVATDVAARGIDVENITHIINYDTPVDKDVYIHRIGRTGRRTNTGTAIIFVTPNEMKFFNKIQMAFSNKIIARERPSKQTIRKKKTKFINKIKSRPNLKRTKGSNLSKEILKLHINAGKKTKMRPTDIVGAISNIEGIEASDIGIISIIDVSTFVEILNNKGEYVFEKLQTTPIKGRLRIVSKANA